jgi:hypothetical protein
MYLTYFLCVDYCCFKTTSSRPIVCLEAAATTELSSIAIGMVLYFPLIRKLEPRQGNIEISDGVFYEFIMQFLFFHLNSSSFSVMQWLKELKSIPWQSSLFFSLDNFENPATGLFILNRL